ncbi:NAD(P)H-dependent flavin oxidoreductase [Candidatus Xianfuyuplasma coldseepsis]|uniref:Nitronate monooxygenase n=1 Tax=Candidatus Xianfuyuplasma coldseepsis TaxID=2782163 RepID=A0A7L7KSI3_9MOLU|nr:nitronate monooxygenase family protein [Xianfuyuplasma coldseepsis]QMS85176.1 nitronate monooxygenase [Xianfuyuplasma coldseepsis]
MKSLRIGDKIARLPIIQGGMGIGVSLHRLASAVANEGGIGVISAAGVGFYGEKTGDFEQDNITTLKAQITQAKEESNGLIGVNIMVALTSFEALSKAAMEANVDFIFAGAGLPLRLPEFRPANTTTKLVPIISSGRAAKLLCKHWIKKYNYVPDAFVVEGPEAGGHLGFKANQLGDAAYSLEVLLPQVLEAIEPFEKEHNTTIPIIVGGGIYTGQDIRRFLDLGASGVQMATRFVPTYECDASDAFKQTYVDAKKEDIVYIKSPVGLPGRAIRNPYLEEVEQGLKHPFTCPYDCIITCKKEEAPYCITLALINAQKGKLHNGFAFAGSNAYKTTKISSIKDVFRAIKQEFKSK